MVVFFFFFALRGYLAKYWNEGMLPDFDPTHWPDPGTGFWLGKRGV